MTTRNEGVELHERLRFAVEAATAAARLTMRWYRSTSLSVDTKANGTEVTAADRAGEELLRERLDAGYPEDAVVGEEHGDRAGRSGWTWHIDPIDGTTSFVHGVPLFGTLLACGREGRSELGVICMPALDETVYAARGQGCWRRVGEGAARPARVSATPTLRDALVLTTAESYFRQARAEGAWRSVSEAAGRTRGWGDCVAFAMVATGRADAAIEPAIMQPWDAAPMPVILAEAGGRFTDWAGDESISTGSALATNGVLHDEVLALLR